MLLYAGGTGVNPDAPSYSFWANTITDLGRVRAWSGKDNIGARIFHNIYIIIMAISLILTGIALRDFFIEKEKDLSDFATTCLIIQGALSLLLLLAPQDTFAGLALYALVALFMYLAATIAAYSYKIAIFHTEEYPNRYGAVFIVLMISSVLYFFMVFIAIGTLGAVYPAALEKILFYTTVVCHFFISYGAWKQIKS